jgi:hypothetical protein
VPRRNRVDPWGDLHAVHARGLFTGNRGCVVDDAENVVRHHGSALWITCVTEFRGWRVAMTRWGSRPDTGRAQPADAPTMIPIGMP